jgi:4-amino-4-deoxy-L-arabinose transferase-like glycosyltransferase
MPADFVRRASRRVAGSTAKHPRAPSGDAPAAASSARGAARPSSHTRRIRPLLAGRSRADLTTAGLLAAIAALYVALLAPMLTLAADDLGLVGVLSTDEQLAGEVVRHMLDSRSLSPNHFFAYGALLPDLAALLLFPASPFGRASDTAVIVTLRSISLTAGAAVIVITGVIAWRVAGRTAAIIAALLLAANPELARWSVSAHPDTLQLALLAATLLAATLAVDRPTAQRVAFCGALAGLTFATKYLGVMLLPLLLFACAAGRAHQGTPPFTRSALLRDALLICVPFAVAFALTNPYAFVEPVRFISQFRAEITHARAGHVFDVGDGRWAWFRALASPGLGGPLITAVGAAALCAVLGRWRPGGLTQSLVRFDGRVLPALWCALYLTYLVAQIGYGAPRYALPLLPALCVGAALAVDSAVRRLARHVRPTYLTAAAPVVAVAMLAFLPTREAVTSLRDRHRAATALDHDPRVVAGRWLDAEAPMDARILRDAYLYLPPSRSNAPITFGLTRDELARTTPAFIMVNEDIRGRFRWEVGAERYVDGPSAYNTRMETYAALEAGTLGCYRLLHDFGTVQVYQLDPSVDLCEQ